MAGDQEQGDRLRRRRGLSAGVRTSMLTSDQLAQFQRDGVLLLPALFSTPEVECLCEPLAELFAEQHSANIREKDSGVVRTAMGLHLRNAMYARLVRHPRLLEPAMQILAEDFYIQQVKVNVKAAFQGESWQWHYDFATHHAEDGVPQPRALNLHVFLDDVTEFNGPLYFLKRSHRAMRPSATLDVETTSYPLWIVDNDDVRRLAEAEPSNMQDRSANIMSATGPAGTGLIFGDAMVHASPNNISPWDRRIFSLIVNPVSNALRRSTRPDHKHHRDTQAVTALEDGCLLAPL